MLPLRIPTLLLLALPLCAAACAGNRASERDVQLEELRGQLNVQSEQLKQQQQRIESLEMRLAAVAARPVPPAPAPVPPPPELPPVKIEYDGPPKSLQTVKLQPQKSGRVPRRPLRTAQGERVEPDNRDSQGNQIIRPSDPNDAAQSQPSQLTRPASPPAQLIRPSVAAAQPLHPSQAPQLPATVELKEPDSARLAELEQPVETAPNGAKLSPQFVADRAFADAVKQLNAGEYGNAQLSFLSFAARYPRNASADDALYYVGLAREASGDCPGAVAAFDRVLREYPAGSARAESKLEKGRCLLMSGRREEGRAVLERMLDEEQGALETQAARKLLDSDLAKR